MSAPVSTDVAILSLLADLQAQVIGLRQRVDAAHGQVSVLTDELDAYRNPPDPD